MCGIAGYSVIGTSERVIDPSVLLPMLDSLAHRGPNESGTYADADTALGSRRLSIIDLANGRQPIFNEDHTVVVVYNGELYNSPKLRRELETNGHVFSTNTDTEVLVHLYEQEGIEFLGRLNGMFGLALLDRTQRRLIVARDRFGVKPVFYSYKDGLFSFASEIKALRIIPGFDSSHDYEALAIFLGLFYIPDPWTSHAGVRKLPPGHYLDLTSAGLTLHRYFDLNFSRKTKVDPREARAETIRLLRQAVSRQLLSDVPVGVLLSGGLDSQSMLLSATKDGKELRPTAFTIGFAERLYDESPSAQRWTEALGCPHMLDTFTEGDLLSGLVPRMAGLDEPYALWCNVATAKLARAIRSQGFKVVLSGEGGDELFCGYPTLNAANAARLYRLLPRFARDRIMRPLAKALPAGKGRLPWFFMLKSFLLADNPDMLRTAFGFKEVVRQEDWPWLLTPEAYAKVAQYNPAQAFFQHREAIAGLPLIDALCYMDFKVFLPGCSFVGNDNAYMSASVESRVPFMDNDLVDFACSLPVAVRFDPLRPKAFFHRALQEFLEQELPQARELWSKRYRKAGFEIPLAEYMAGNRFRPFLCELLSPRRVASTGFFRPDAVARLLDEQIRGLKNHERVIQAIACLELYFNGRHGSGQ